MARMKQKETRLSPATSISSPDWAVPAWAEDLHPVVGMDWVLVALAALAAVDWATHWRFEDRASSSPFQG